MTDHTSISTHQIAGRGTVKVMARAGLPSLNVGDVIRIDGIDWIVRGTEGFRAGPFNELTATVGVLVRLRAENDTCPS